jgi:hypothetical protein
MQKYSNMNHTDSPSDRAAPPHINSAITGQEDDITPPIRGPAPLTASRHRSGTTYDPTNL